MHSKSQHDTIFDAIAEYRRLEKRANRLSDDICGLEYAAAKVIGPRPPQSIGWRRYASVGGAELEGIRDKLLAEGLPPELVQREYIDAKARERVAKKAAMDWYRQAGLTEIKRQQVAAYKEMRASLARLGRTPPQTLAGAAALTAYLRRDMRAGQQDWQLIAMSTLEGSLKSLAQT